MVHQMIHTLLIYHLSYNFTKPQTCILSTLYMYCCTDILIIALKKSGLSVSLLNDMGHCRKYASLVYFNDNKNLQQQAVCGAGFMDL